VRVAAAARCFLVALAVPLSVRAGPKELTGETEPTERTFVVGGGGAFEVEPGSVKGGAAIFTEVEVIDGVLEVELGGQSVWGRSARELSADLLFKWPRRVTQNTEVMIGAGPTIVGANGTSWGIEFAVDVMWWRTRRLGLWIEPTYDVFFTGGAANSFGVTAGPMFAW
jgi:hypothetical protein